MIKQIGTFVLGLLALNTVMTSCNSSGSGGRNGAVSEKTGWSYNNPNVGGFEIAKNHEQMAGPGTVFVQGGRFTMGQRYDDVMFENNSIPRSVTVSSFYMDETEVANVHYREYIYWMHRTYGSDYPKLVHDALPDTTVWRSDLSYNEPMVKYYFRHAAFDYYPVVGVSWEKANKYCQWRSDRVNELMLKEAGYLIDNPDQINEESYHTDAYLQGLYEGEYKNKKYSYDPNILKDGRNVNYSDGILQPDYRLPTEAEWEFAALAVIGNNPEPANNRRTGESAFTDRQVYPWADNDRVRWELNNQYQGQMLANFNQGNGSYMGVPGGLNDNADRPNEIYSYVANDLGLYNMAGNVSEWTLDVYRPITSDQEKLNPYRGNEYYTVQLNEEYQVEDKDTLGSITVYPVDTNEANIKVRPNMRYQDVRGIGAGDTHHDYDTKYEYNYNKSVSKYTNTTRVYKGGSWQDRAYYLMPSTRRYLDQKQSTATIGFRCVMDRVGAPTEATTRNTSNFGSSKKRR